MATSHGILVDAASEILSTQTAVDILGRTFTGGIFNAGVISGGTGIKIVSASAVSIFDAGAIIGSDGTAIQFAGSGNTLTLGAGYVISGIVDPSGNNTLQLGGSGSANFDLSSVGAAAQYRGFTTFNVIGGAWTVSGTGSGWNVRGGLMELTSGTLLSNTLVSGGGTLVVDFGATASATVVKSGGTDVILSGGTAVGVTVSSGGAIELLSGQVVQSQTLASGAIVAVGSGYVLTSAIGSGLTVEVLSGGVVSGATFGAVADKRLLIFSGGVASDVTIGSGGTAIVFAGGTDDGATILKGGTDVVSSGGVDLGVVVNSGGTEIVSAGGVASNTTVSSGGVQMVASGGTADPTVILSGGTEVVSAHGSDLGAQISGGTQVVFGVASGATVFSGAQLVRAGGTASDTAVSGGSAIVSAGGSAVDMTIASGATAVILSGASARRKAAARSRIRGSLINSGTIYVVDGGTLAVDAAVVSNKGTINLQGVDGGAGATLLLDPAGGQVVLSGGGKIALSSSGNNFFSVGTTVTLTNRDNTIAGAGRIGDGNSPLILINGGTINANTGNALTIDVPEPIVNSGIMEATNSGGLYLLARRFPIRRRARLSRPAARPRSF